MLVPGDDRGQLPLCLSDGFRLSQRVRHSALLECFDEFLVGEHGHFSRQFVEFPVPDWQVWNPSGVLLQRHPRFWKVAQGGSRSVDLGLQNTLVERCPVDVLERDVVVRDTVQQDHKLHEVGVGLLPERLLPFFRTTGSAARRSGRPASTDPDPIPAGCSTSPRQALIRRSRVHGPLAPELPVLGNRNHP